MLVLLGLFCVLVVVGIFWVLVFATLCMHCLFAYVVLPTKHLRVVARK